METLIHFVLLFTILGFCVCPPVTKKSTETQNESENEVDHLEAMGIEYNRYLKQVVEALEGDADFRRKLENAQEADIRSGKIAEELDFVNHHVRTKLDELKRQELERLRNLARLAMEKENNQDSPHLKAPEHLDHANPNSFEIADLHKLIKKVTLDLEEADKKRRDDFKQYEMQKEFEQKEKMKDMDEEHKKKYEEELEEMKKKHMKHEPLHHPGGKQQLEEVWEKQDHMEQEFDPKTFFYLHDLDGNGFWDQEEVKALFLKELDKLYQAGVPEDDMRERAEEMERMREHVFQESDTDRDGLISFKEFLQQTQKPEFEKDQGWETIDQKQVYTPEEYAEFERRRQEEVQRLIREGKLPPHPPGWAPPPQGMHPGVAHPQYQYQGQGIPQQAHLPQGQYAGQHPNSVYQQPHDQQAYQQQQQIYKQQQKQQIYQQQQQQAYHQQQQQQQAYHQQQQQAYQQQQNQYQPQQAVPPQQFQQGSPQSGNQQDLSQKPVQPQQVPQKQPISQQVPQQQAVPQQVQQQPPALQVPQQPVEQQPPPEQVVQQPKVQQEPLSQQSVEQKANNDPNAIIPEHNAPTVRYASGIPRQPVPK